jgi:hypothetical protein
MDKRHTLSKHRMSLIQHPDGNVVKNISRTNGIFNFLKTTCVEPYCPWRAIAFGDGGPKKTVKISAFYPPNNHNMLSASHL